MTKETITWEDIEAHHKAQTKWVNQQGEGSLVRIIHKEREQLLSLIKADRKKYAEFAASSSTLSLELTTMKEEAEKYKLLVADLEEKLKDTQVQENQLETVIADNAKLIELNQKLEEKISKAERELLDQEKNIQEALNGLKSLEETLFRNKT